MYLAVDFRNITTITEQGLGYRAQQQNIWIDFYRLCRALSATSRT